MNLEREKEESDLIFTSIRKGEWVTLIIYRESFREGQLLNKRF